MAVADLRAAILARLDQLEATAREAMEPRQHAGVHSQGRWTLSDTTVWDDDAMVTVAGTHDGPFLDVEHAQHIATWHPQAVLTLCAGARQLLDWTAHRPEYEPAGIYAVREEQPVVLDHLARMLGIDPDAT